MPWSKQGTLGGPKPATYAGSWKASAGLSFKHGAVTPIPLNSAIGTSSGIVNQGGGVWRIDQTGYWSFSLICDLQLANTGDVQEWLITVVGPNGTIASNQFVWTVDAWTVGTAAGLGYLTAGQTVWCEGVWYRASGSTATYWNVSADRTNFTAVRVAG